LLQCAEQQYECVDLEQNYEISSKLSLVDEASFEVKRVEPISHAMASPAVPWSKS
jgi:hypothetical protein